MTERVRHTDVAAFALGVLDAADRHAFELHLHRCETCQQELRNLDDLSTLLHRVDKELAVPTPAPREDDVRELFRRSAAARRQDVRLQRLVAAVMLIVLPAVGALSWSALNPAVSRPSRPAASPEPHSAELAGTGEIFNGTSINGLQPTVAIDSAPWGTRVTLQLPGASCPLECLLIAVDRTGAEETVMSWRTSAQGNDASSIPKPLVLGGSVATARDRIGRFEVRTSDGDVLSRVQIG